MARSLAGFPLDHPHPEDVEIDPLRLTADGLIALDAVITQRPDATAP